MNLSKKKNLNFLSFFSTKDWTSCERIETDNVVEINATGWIISWEIAIDPENKQALLGACLEEEANQGIDNMEGNINGWEYDAADAIRARDAG